MVRSSGPRSCALVEPLVAPLVCLPQVGLPHVEAAAPGVLQVHPAEARAGVEKSGWSHPGDLGQEAFDQLVEFGRLLLGAAYVFDHRCCISIDLFR